MAAFCHPFLFLLLGLTGISGSQSDVKCTTSNPAVLGGKVTLTCECKSLYLDIEQLTWQKKKDNVLQNIATKSKKYGVKIDPSCNQRISVNGTELNRSSITISDLKLEDETLYICIFNVFPFGGFKGKVYLPVSAIQQQIQKDDDTAAIQQQIQKDDDTAGMLDSHGRLLIMSMVLAILLLLCVVVGFLYYQKKHVKSTQAVTPMKSIDPENIEFRTPPRSNYTSIPGSSTSKRKSCVARNDDISLLRKSLFPSQAVEPYFSREC
ncbi:uncharacterized protein LOC128474946 [Spea bombifrons]|uniref:uncharacterized protein LOC128474946 n=1 Tax=Spea bombifrons TaxID=233779 RepID=UPI00234A23DD|nr:uncharacterized protein LOC128474946 [Spea bombifrons]